MRRLASKTVFLGFMADWFLAAGKVSCVRRHLFRVQKELTITDETLALGESDVRRGGSVTLVYGKGQSQLESWLDATGKF